MPLRAVALLSGGLDSILAVRVMQEQGVEVESLNFRTMFACCQETASQAAARLGVRLTVIGAEDSYLDVIRKPKHGYGRGANPCVDCRIYMFERARTFMDEVGASLVISGEVLGQRPMSQKRRDLDVIAEKSGLHGCLLRPLSAKLLPPTIPELTGAIDRNRLYDFVGRSRKGLIALARQFGYEDCEIPSPSTGCMLTEQTFAPRVHDLVQIQTGNTAWDFELLKWGRHFRFDTATKVVVGRRQSDNAMLEYLIDRPDARVSAILRPHNFSGPLVIVVGRADDDSNDDAIDFAAGLMRRYSKLDGRDDPVMSVESRRTTSLRLVGESLAALAAATM